MYQRTRESNSGQRHAKGWGETPSRIARTFAASTQHSGAPAAREQQIAACILGKYAGVTYRAQGVLLRDDHADIPTLRWCGTPYTTSASCLKRWHHDSSRKAG